MNICNEIYSPAHHTYKSGTIIKSLFWLQTQVSSSVAATVGSLSAPVLVSQCVFVFTQVITLASWYTALRDLTAAQPFCCSECYLARFCSVCLETRNKLCWQNQVNNGDVKHNAEPPSFWRRVTE